MEPLIFTNHAGERKTVVFGIQLQDGYKAITHKCTIDGVEYIIKNIKLDKVSVVEIQKQFAIEAALIGRLSTCSNPAIGIACFKGVLVGTATRLAPMVDAGSLINSFVGTGVYFLYEYVIGHELTTFAGTMTPKESIAIMVEVFKIIQTLHQAGIVHLDIKPENIMLRDDKTPVFIDFEYACEVSTCRLSKMVGTPLYCAPEMYRAASTPIALLPPLDIYAAGMTMFAFFINDLFAMRLRDPLINSHPHWDLVEKAVRKIRKFSNPEAERIDTAESKALFIERGYSDELWTLFLRMIDADPVKRPSIDEIVEILAPKAPAAAAAAAVPVVGLAPRAGCGIFGCFGRGGRRTQRHKKNRKTKTRRS
jgi:serine/threonine protein kinase